MREVFSQEGWEALEPDARGRRGMEEAREAMGYLSKLAVFAEPETIRAAHGAFDAVDAMRMHNLEVLETGGRVEKDWSLYWSYAQAKHAFMTSSRREMGLKPPPALRPEVLPARQEPRWAVFRGQLRRRIRRDATPSP